MGSATCQQPDEKPPGVSQSPAGLFGWLNANIREYQDEVVVFILGVVMSVAYLLITPHTTPMNDAYDYLNAGKALAGLPILRDLVDDQKFLATHFFRAPWYVILTAKAQFLFHRFGDITVINAVRYAQGILWAFNLVLVYQLAKHLTNSKHISRFAALLALTYPSLLLQTDRLLTETQTATLFLLFGLLWVKRRYRWSGVLLFATLSNSFLSLWPKTMLLVGLLGIGLALSRNRQTYLHPIVQTALTYLPLATAFQVWYNLTPHTGFKPVYFWQYFDTQGWAPLMDFNGMIMLLTSQSYSLPEPLTALPPTITEPLKLFLKHTDVFLTRYGVNVYRFFIDPDNPYEQRWLLPPVGIRAYHQLILFGWLAALPASARCKPLRLLFVMPLWWALAYAGTNIELRYNLPIMALLLTGSAIGWTGLWERLNQGEQHARDWIALLGVGFFALMLSGVFYPFVINLWEAVTPTLYRTVAIIGLTTGLYILLQQAFRYVQPERWSVPILSLLISGGVCWLLVLNHITDLQPMSWQTRLTSKQSSVRQFIPITKAFFAPSLYHAAMPMTTFLVLEVDPVVDPSDQRLAITINGLSLNEASPYTSEHVPFGLSYQNHLLGGFRQPKEVRQYRMIPLPKSVEDSVRQAMNANVQIKLIGNHPKPMTLFGDYPADRQGGYVVPNPDWGAFSVYKYVYDWEGRIPIYLPYEVPTSKLPTGDLSDDPGLQTGHYRIFMVRMLSDDANELDYPHPKFSISQQGEVLKDFRIAY